MPLIELRHATNWKLQGDEMSRKVIHIADMEGAEVDDTCGMKYWYSFMEGGRGIIPKDHVIPDLIDREIHNDLAAIAEMEVINPSTLQAAVDEILARLTPKDKEDQYKMELLYRRLGWLVAFALYVEPNIRATFDTIKTDRELLLNRDPLFVVTYPDRILKSKANGELSYREYVMMPPGMNRHLWLNSWQYRVRLHIGQAAAEASLKQHVTYGQVMGLSKGYYSIMDKRLVHPYVWGYYHARKEEWTHSDAVIKENASGWQMMPTWKFPGGIIAWVRMCGEAAAFAQFPMSGVVKQNMGLVEEWSDHRLHREREIKGVNGACQGNHKLRAIYFAKQTKECTTTMGEDCPYMKACWDKKLNNNLAGKDGLFVSKANRAITKLSEVPS